MKKTLHLFTLLLHLLFASSCIYTETTEKQEKVETSPVIANDISNQKISSFAEDAQGHIWIGTFRGLNKYNAHGYHQYFCTDDSIGLPDSQIQDVFRDSQNRLWIATVNGICQYTDKDSFKPIPLTIPNQNGVQFLENKEGRIFLNMVVHLCAYNSETKQLDCLIHDFDPQRTFNVKCYIDSFNDLWAINPLSIRRYNSSTMELKDSIPTKQHLTYSYMHNNGELWLISNNNLSIFDTRTRKYIETPSPIRNHPLLSHSSIYYIHPYGNNSLLISTQNGMFLYNYIEEHVVRQGENGFPFEVPNFRISKMFTDSQKNLWIGSVDQGYVVRYNYKERFNNNNYLRSIIENKSVVALAVDKEKHLWISTLMNCMYMYDLNKQKIEKIDIHKLVPREKGKNIDVSQIFIDNNNSIWLLCNTSHKIIKCKYLNKVLKAETVYSIFAPMCITQDRNKTIWVGTYSEVAYALKKGETTFKSIQLYPKWFCFTPSMKPLSNGNIIVSSFGQMLHTINPDTWKIQQLMIPQSDIQQSIRRSRFIPTALFEDTHGDVWVGTVGNGLMLYSPSTNRLQPIPGTPCTDICSIEEDLEGNIWVSTQYGLCKYDRTVKQFTTYYAADGIGGNQFYDRASCRLPDGALVFGGTHGLTLFNPIDVAVKRDIPLLFEDLKIHNKLIHPHNKGCIDKHLSYKPDIHLKYNQNSFSISFSALDYCEYEKAHYYYMLEGFDKFWIDARNKNEAYYANLPSGKYIFKVRVTNNDKSIVEAENSIPVMVSSAPWASWWAYCLYFIIAAGIIYLLFSSWLRIKAEKEATLRAEHEKAQEQRVNKMNMSFFANVSHEFRTPLTMISAPVAQLCDRSDISENNKKLLHIIQRSVNRMLKLVNQLMDFDKLENDTLRLKVKRTDIISILQQLANVFLINAQNKSITLSTYGLEDTFILWLDEDKVDKIIGNLLSNALKFTPAGGKIGINFDLITREDASKLFPLTFEDKDTQYIKIAITDTGNGIPEKQLEKIFMRYYQIEDHSKGVYNWGAGIGLYYARSLVELHHGHLKASNQQEGTGAIFTLILPINDVSYSEEERFQDINTQESAFPLFDNEQCKFNECTDAKEGQQTLLVVDDDTEVVHYLKTLLSPYYKIICCFDANSAFKSISEEFPDLILSDIVMPGINGYQLCHQIKEELQLCHIPVILITAKATVDNQVEGLNIGADAYVTKPFDPNYLLALIKSQLKNREKIRNILGSTTQTKNLSENLLTPHDNAFMTDLYRLMEIELSNTELDIARMTSLLKISRTKFYYKVKGLTGKNPGVFFKTYKLNRAVELISEGKYTISEIADMTGFATLSHFSVSFKKHFGIAPSEYKNSTKNECTDKELPRLPYQ
nr:two-component regulator propeller domain-containing protein [uncultured Bacteroides sp.]